MNRRVFPITFAAFALVGLAAHAHDRSPAQDTFTYWFEARGLPREQVDIVARAFAGLAESSTHLVAAARPEVADLFVRVAVGAASIGSIAPGAQPGGGDEGAGSPVRVQGDATIEVFVRLTDILGGGVLSEQRLRCRPPFTQGRTMVAACLRSYFPRLIESMEVWAERERAALARPQDFVVADAEGSGFGTEDRARAYYREAVRALEAGFEARALELMAEAQPLFKEAGLRREEGAAWEHLAYLIAVTHRGPARAVTYAEQAIRIAQELGDTTTEARALNLLAACEARLGNYTRAVTIASRAAGAARSDGDILSEATSGVILAGLTAVKGDFDQARVMQDDALALVAGSGVPRAEARHRLAIAVTIAQDDDREQSASLARLEELRIRARELGDLSLLRDVALVTADTRLATVDFELVSAGEVDAIRGLKLASRLGDGVGEAAAVGLLGVFAMRLGKLGLASDYLALAQQRARQVDFLEGLSDSVQALGELATDLERGATLLQRVGDSRAQEGDLRGQIKSLLDLSRSQAALERYDEGWTSYRQATAVVDEYVRRLQENPDLEDVRISFTNVLKSLVTTRIDLPYLVRHLRVEHLVPLPDPTWALR